MGLIGVWRWKCQATLCVRARSLQIQTVVIRNTESQKKIANVVCMFFFAKQALSMFSCWINLKTHYFIRLYLCWLWDEIVSIMVHTVVTAKMAQISTWKHVIKSSIHIGKRHISDTYNKQNRREKSHVTSAKSIDSDEKKYFRYERKTKITIYRPRIRYSDEHLCAAKWWPRNELNNRKRQDANQSRWQAEQFR